MSLIQIVGANEANLKNISVEIPKNKLVVFTGVSGSGKSTLLVDVLFNECQRQYLEAMSMQGIRKPKVDYIRNVSPAIIISQTDTNKNPRSTVGTITDVYTDLRMIYEKLGYRKCPNCQQTISSANCKEETEKRNQKFYVYMYCSECGFKMPKLTRTNFSFNTQEGACATCEGLGKVHQINKDNVLNQELSLEQGAVRFWEHQYKTYQISVLYNTYQHYGLEIPKDIAVKEFDKLQQEILLNGIENKILKEAFPTIKPPKTVAEGRFEGIYPLLWRRFAEKQDGFSKMDIYFDSVICPECHGERLNELSRSIVVNKSRLPELSVYSLERLMSWIKELRLSLSAREQKLVEDYLLDIETKLNRFLNVGLGYLSLDRQTTTLSGGELQRLRLAAVLDSDLSGIIYILDEPTQGLHPKDTSGLIKILQRLRDLGNSVLIIEHDPDVINKADYIVDIGPGSGKHGGEIVGQGTLLEIKRQPESVTGNYLSKKQVTKKNFRPALTNKIRIENATKFNLKNIDLIIPTGNLVAIVGPSGSGKSTLVFEVLAKGNKKSKDDRVIGLDQFSEIINIEQSSITRMKRSNVATFSEVYTEIRDLFANTTEAKEQGLSAKNFSFNVAGGRCENCEGLGYVDSNMLFFTNTEIVCPVCNGNQFNEQVLAVKFHEKSIKEVLSLSVEEAVLFFKGYLKIERILKLLQDVGLEYLELGQTLTTLSGGESQRLKLAKNLLANNTKGKNLYLLDEPTTGLHPNDVEHFLVLLNRIVDAGNTVLVVEHNQQIIQNSDWVIELGPSGGEKGGEIIFEGTPTEMLKDNKSITASFLRKE